MQVSTNYKCLAVCPAYDAAMQQARPRAVGSPTALQLHFYCCVLPKAQTATLVCACFWLVLICNVLHLHDGLRCHISRG